MKLDQKELDTLKYLKEVIVAYEEIASIRIRRVKDRVLQNREFSEGLNDVYQHVRVLYKNELESSGKNTASIRKTNGKSVCVFLSANTGLYGNIIYNVFRDFKSHVKSNPDDVVVVGRVGTRLVEGLHLSDREIKSFEITDGMVSTEDSQELFNYLANYSKITVFHGKFKDIITQVPSSTVVSDDIFSPTAEGEDQENSILKTRYVFEPTLHDIMSYFEKEILTSLVEHSLHESNLSKYSSRMVSLERAVDKIEGKISDTTLGLQRVKHRVANSKQVNRMSGMKFLGKI